jgi:hypothetical protein
MNIYSGTNKLPASHKIGFGRLRRSLGPRNIIAVMVYNMSSVDCRIGLGDDGIIPLTNRRPGLS